MSWEPWRQRQSSYRRSDDPCPPVGVGEDLYCTLKARFGYWSPTFLRYVRDCYNGTIPGRFLSRVAHLERTRPWDVPESPHTGDPPTIVIVNLRGHVIAQWQPTHEEWREAGELALESRT